MCKYEPVLTGMFIRCMEIKKSKWLSGHAHISPVNRPVDPKQIATEIINTPAFSL